MILVYQSVIDNPSIFTIFYIYFLLLNLSFSKTNHLIFKTIRLTDNQISPIRGCHLLASRKYTDCIPTPNFHLPLSGAFSMLPRFSTVPYKACCFSLISYCHFKCLFLVFLCCFTRKRAISSA